MLVAAGLLSACALVGPESRDEYALTAVNGIAVPVTVPQGTLDGQPFAERILSGKLVLFESGGFSWELTTAYLVNGQPSPQLPNNTVRLTGAYDRMRDTLMLSWYLKATRVTEDSWDVHHSGLLSRNTYTVVRQR